MTKLPLLRQSKLYIYLLSQAKEDQNQQMQYKKVS